MSEERSGRGCLKGCVFGCLGLVVLFLGTAGIVGLLQFRGSSIAVNEINDRKSQTLPLRPATAEQIADATDELSLDVDSDLEQLRFAEVPDWQSTESVGTLKLDLRMGEFEVIPSDGDSIEVVADYDENRFRLAETFVEGGDGSWTYEVKLEPKRRFMGFTSTRNRVEIRVPRSHPLDLEGEVAMGESDLDLSGLWIREVDLELGQGEHTVRFEEATRAPVESLTIVGEMGELNVFGVGNASPLAVDLSHRMGELDVGLDGAWRNDASVRARCRMGELRLVPAEGVRYATRGSRVFMGGKSGRLPEDDSLGEETPLIGLDLGVTMGSINIR